MELSTILLIYLALGCAVSIISTIACVIDDQLTTDEVMGIMLLSLTWPVSLVPFLVMLLFNYIKYRDNK